VRSSAATDLPSYASGTVAAVIELPFDPVVALGPLRLTWHAIFSLVGVLAGAALGIRLVLARISFDDAWAVAIGGVLGGLPARASSSSSSTSRSSSPTPSARLRWATAASRSSAASSAV